MSEAAGGDDVAEDVLLVARFALYPEAFDAEDGLQVAALVRFREWFNPWLADRLRAERAEGAREALEEAADAWHERQVTLHGPIAGYEKAKKARWWLRARAAAHATQEPT